MNKRNAAIIGAMVLAALLLAVYLFGFTATQRAERSLTPMIDDAQGWDIYVLEDGARAALSVEDTWSYPGTVYLERSVSREWSEQGYTRVRMSSDRWYSVFVDGTLVYTNCPQAGSSLPVAFPSGKPADFRSLPGFSLASLEEGDTLTVASAAIGPQGAGSPGFVLTSDAVEEAVIVAWANRHTMPALLFAALFALLLVVFGYSLIRDQANFGLLILAVAALMEMFYFLSLFEETEWTFWLRPLLLQACLLLPPLYCALRMETGKARFLPLLLVSWAVPFAALALDYAGAAPVWLLNAAPYLMFLPLAALMPLGERERRAENGAFRLLMPGWYGCMGVLTLLFLLSVAFQDSFPRFGGGSLLAWLNDVVRGAVELLPQPLAHLLNVLLLATLFFTAALEQVKRSVEREEELKLLSMKNDLALESIRALEQGGEALAVARHDELHHLRVLAEMAKDAPEKAADYAASLVEELSALPPMGYTQNRLVNTILSAQAGKAGAQCVEFRAEAILPETLSIPDKDLCAVLMNLLDNAVNAAAKAPAGADRLVSVRLRTEQGYLLIAVENALPEGFDQAAFRETLNKGAHPLRARHGFGMRSAQLALARYGGELRYSIKGGVLAVNTAMSLQAGEGEGSEL